MSGQSHYKTIEIPSVLAVTGIEEELAYFPFLFARDGDADIGARANPDGSDLRFTLDGEPLPYEIEHFGIDGGAASFRAWGLLPAAAAAAGIEPRCYYGNPAASDAQDPPAVWTPSGHGGVWHLHSNLTNSVTGVAATDNGTVGFAAGVVGNGREGDGTGTGLLTDIIANGATHTFAFWQFAKTNNAHSGEAAFPNALILGYSGVGGIHALIGSAYATGGAMATNTWHRLALVGAGASAQLYLDGEPSGSPVAYTFPAGNTTAMRLLYVAGFGSPLDGILDEARYSTVAHSAAWMKFEHANMAAAGWQQTWGDETEVPPPPLLHWQRLRTGVATRTRLATRIHPKTRLEIGAR